jgi:hypothetical protein
MSFVESLNPLIGYIDRKDNWVAMLIRLSIAAFFISIAIQMYLYPEIFEYLWEWISYFYNESFNWGNEKLKNYHSNKSGLTIIDNHERIMRAIKDI